MESRDWYVSVQHPFENLWKASAVFFQCRGESCNWQHFPKLLGKAVPLTWHWNNQNKYKTKQHSIMWPLQNYIFIFMIKLQHKQNRSWSFLRHSVQWYTNTLCLKKWPRSHSYHYKLKRRNRMVHEKNGSDRFSYITSPGTGNSVPDSVADEQRRAVQTDHQRRQRVYQQLKCREWCSHWSLSLIPASPSMSTSNA